MAPSWPKPGCMISWVKYPIVTSRASMTLTSKKERTWFLRASSNISALETDLWSSSFFRGGDLPVRLIREIEESGGKQGWKALAGGVVFHHTVVLELPGGGGAVFRGGQFFLQGRIVLVRLEVGICFRP